MKAVKYNRTIVLYARVNCTKKKDGSGGKCFVLD